MWIGVVGVRVLHDLKAEPTGKHFLILNNTLPALEQFRCCSGNSALTGNLGDPIAPARLLSRLLDRLSPPSYPGQRRQIGLTAQHCSPAHMRTALTMVGGRCAVWLMAVGHLRSADDSEGPAR